MLRGRHGWGLLLVLALMPAWAQLPDHNSLQQSSGPQQVYGADARTRARVHTELAALYFQDGNMGVALEELGIALRADANYAPAYSVRGLVHAYLKEKTKAEEDFRRALSIAPTDSEINNNYGWFLCQNGQERQSITYFLNALKNPLYETPDRAYTNAGACALAAGDLEGAENYLTYAIKLSRDGGLAPRVQLAVLQYRKGNLDEARRTINEILKAMDPPPPEALWLALRIERKMGNRNAEGALAAQLRGRYPASKEYQDFLKGNFE